MALKDFLPLFSETPASIRARLDADADALAGDEPYDLREGTFYHLVTQLLLLEFARKWDALATEVPAAAFPTHAWGEYLDMHAEVFDLVRNPAVPARGQLTFRGEPGTVVAVGTITSTDAAGDSPRIEFVTTTAGTIGDRLEAPDTPTATPVAAASALVAGTYRYQVTALSEFGETDANAEVEVAADDGDTVTLDWPDVPGAVGYRVYRASVAEADKRRVAEVAGSTWTDDGTAVPGEFGPSTVNLSAGVTVSARATEEGITGNVSIGAIVNIDSPVAGAFDVVNLAPFTGGADEESDPALRARILDRFRGAGGGREADYRRWALEYGNGIGRAFVRAAWLGPGTVQVVVMTADGDPVAAEVVAGLQQWLEEERAPIGHDVTVQTPDPAPIVVAGQIVFEPGYSLDGAGGTTALRSQIEASIAEYLNSLDVGEDVIYEHVKSRFFAVPGVYNVADVEVGRQGSALGTADIALSSAPPETATFHSADLAE